MWEKLSLALKLNILEGESTVLVDMLRDCDQLMLRLRNGCSKSDALKIINESF